MIAVIAGMISSNAHAATASAPAVLQYQARLSGANGPLADQLVDVEAWIYDSPTEGIAGDLANGHLLYAEAFQKIRVQRGMLRLGLGEGDALGGFAGAPLPMEKLAAAGALYLQIIVNGESIEPRQRFGFDLNVFRAQYAKVAEKLSGNFTLSAADLPLLPASKVTGPLPKERIPQFDRSIISGDLNDAIIPSLTLDILVSGTLDAALIAGIDSADITSGVFAPQRFTTVLYGDDISIMSGTTDPSNMFNFMPADPPGSACAQIVALNSFSLSNYKADGLLVYNAGQIAMCLVETESVLQDWITEVANVPCTAQYLKVCVRKG